jgi:tRNA (guanine37-N1)-methyltransferase
MSFTAQILTLFPELFPGFLGHSITGRALQKKLWTLTAINIRDFATDKHATIDDVPFGGGAGMVMKPDIIERALVSLPSHGRKIYMSPRGKVLNQSLAQELSHEPILTILCGRYEGVDQRILDEYNFEEISIGDYILTGGEQAAQIMLDSIIRLLPDVVGNDQTIHDESFSNGMLEYPHYTRPASWISANGNTLNVPDVLISGHHKNISEWRTEQSKIITQKNRPDLLK